MTLQNFFTSRKNGADGQTHIGSEGRLWYEPVTNTIRVHDGSPGGLVVGGSSGPNSDVTFANVHVTGAVYSDTYLFANGAVAISSVPDLGNLSITDQTISGLVTNRDITLAPLGTGLVALPGLKVPTGSLIQGNSSVISTIAALRLENVYAYSDNTLTSIPPNTYGVHSAIAAPWSVYFFKTTPAPVLQIGDNIAGAGIPLPSNVEFVGDTGQYANIVITSQTYYGLPTPIPPADTNVFTTRAVVNAGLNFVTDPSTDIVFNTGANGFVVSHSDILPYTTDTFSLGSPQKRWKEVYIGPSTIYIQDSTTGIDLSIGALDGNLVVSGGNGLTVGKFTFHGNTIALLNSAEDFYVGTQFATGNVNINRPLQVLSNTGIPSFVVDRDGLTKIYSLAGADATQSLVSVVGSASRYQQPRATQHDGTLLQLTAIDGKSARISVDSFGSGLYPILTGRAARGTVTSPLPTVKDDVLLRFAAIGWTGNGLYGAAQTRLDFKADQTFTSNVSTGTYIELQTTPIGSNVLTSTATFRGNVGMILGQNTGITFADTTVQTTAFIPGQQVASVTLGTGILQQGRQIGNVTIDTTDVHSVASGSDSLTVANVTPGSNNLRLTLAQEIGTNSSPTFNNLYVNSNLYVAGNIISQGSSSINDKKLYLANNSTSSADISGGGIQLGANGEAYSRSLLYNLTGPHGDYWSTDPDTGIQTEHLVASDVYLTGNLYSNGSAKFGGAYNGFNFATASIQSVGSVNGFEQIVNQNLSGGTNASADIVATNNLGTDSNYFIDMGINGSNYNGTPVGWTISGANDAYLYNADGNLTIGTSTADNVISFHTGGTLATNIRADITDAGITSRGNVGAIFYTGNGYYLTGLLTAGSLSSINADLITLFANAGTQQNQIGAITSNITTLQSQVYSNVNAAAYIPLNSTVVNIQNNITALFANATIQENEISDLRSNIISANSAISTLQTNVGAYQSFANTWLANLQNNITTLFSNADTQNTWLSNLQADIGTINANITAANSAISTLQSNVGAYHSFANTWLANLQANSNSGSQAIWLSNLQSNVTTLFSNANFQNTWLSNLQANIAALNANVGAYETWANSAITNSGNVTTKPYGSFWDDTKVTTNASIITNGANVSLGNTFANSGVYISNANEIHFGANGVYRLDYTLQFHNSDNKQNNVAVWFRKNGNNITQSASWFTLPAQGSVNGYICAVGPFVDGAVTTSDFYQISWHATDTHISLKGVSSTGPMPGSPAAMVFVTKL